MRDHAFTVTGGVVTKARQLDPPGNIGWEIRVTPEGDGAVTIVLPVTTDCTAQGAICTGGRRPLSNRLEVTVPGPPGQQASQENSPATGAPTISGTAQVGETLVADLSRITDADGKPSDAQDFAYQWVRVDGLTATDIAGAMAPRYALADADVGKTIKVQVSFTDLAGFSEGPLTSAATEQVLGDGPPGVPGKPTITAGDRELTLSWEPSGDNGNAPAKLYRIEWRRDGQDYDTNQWTTVDETTYTVPNLANGISYTVRVKARNDSGYGPPSEEASGTPTSGSAVDLDTPVLSEPEILHHRMVKLDWQDIEGADSYEVQFYNNDDEWVELPADDVEIAVHGSSAVVSNLDGGLTWLRVRAVSCAGASEWSKIEELYGTNASDWEDVPVPTVEEGDEAEPCPEDLDTPDNSPATGAATISGTAQVGETLTADTSSIEDTDGLENVIFSYQWLAADSAIRGAMGRDAVAGLGDPLWSVEASEIAALSRPQRAVYGPSGRVGARA